MFDNGMCAAATRRHPPPKQSRGVLTFFLCSTIFAYTNMKTILTSNRIDLMFRAFSDRNRLRILHLLQEKEMCVGDIVDVLQAPQPRVSRHLAYLRKAGMVIARKEGLWNFYSLAPSQNEFHKNLLECLGKCFGDVPEIKADAARAGRIQKGGGCCPKQ